MPGRSVCSQRCAVVFFSLFTAQTIAYGQTRAAELPGGSLNATGLGGTDGTRPVLIGTSSLPRQSGTPSGGPQTKAGDLPIVLSIDGKVTPERIPDDVAYRHFISATAIGRGASVADLHRRNAVLEEAGLSDADSRSYILATMTVKDSLLAIEHRLEESHLDISKADALKQEWRTVLDNAAQRILSSLSAEGVARVRAHINERVKRRIRIYSQVHQLPGRDQ